jgi:hypothetical protein
VSPHLHRGTTGRRLAALSITALFATPLGLAACTVPTIPQRPLTLAGSPPSARPEVHLEGRPLEPAGGSLTLAVNVIAAPAPYGDESAAAGTRPRFALILASLEADQRYTLVLTLNESLLPLLAAGEQCIVTYYFQYRDVLSPPAAGIVIRTPEGKLRYLLSIDAAVPPEALPPGLAMHPTQTLAFSTERISQAGCTVDKEHLFFELTTPDNVVRMAPGDECTVPSHDGPYAVFALDNSRSTADVECLAYDPTHVTYIVREVPQEE